MKRWGQCPFMKGRIINCTKKLFYVGSMVYAFVLVRFILVNDIPHKLWSFSIIYILVRNCLSLEYS